MSRVLITSGPTREAIDPVRFLSNASTGRMGAALAAEALARGHEVEFVTGPAETPPPCGVVVHRVESTIEMLETCRGLHAACDVVIGAAAVCDYRPAKALHAKRPRTDQRWLLELVPNPDILAELGRAKGERTHVGFALETSGDRDAAIARARDKLRRKRLDWIVLNAAAAIGAEEGAFALVTEDEAVELGSISKRELARAVFERLEG